MVFRSEDTKRLEVESKHEISRQKTLKQELEARQNPKGGVQKIVRIARFEELNSKIFN